jgi:hypothetical protein
VPKIRKNLFDGRRRSSSRRSLAYRFYYCENTTLALFGCIV